MTKHTQEKWVVEPDGDHLMVCTNLLEICTIQPVDRGGIKAFYLGEETTANARLIAAAPDLLVVAQDFLEALSEQGLLCECGEFDCRTSRARAAIRKARGEQP